MAQPLVDQPLTAYLLLFLGKLSTVSPLFCSCYRPLASIPKLVPNDSWLWTSWRCQTSLSTIALPTLISLLSFFFLFNPLGTRERRRGKRRGGLGSSPIFSNLSGLRLGLEQAGNPFCLLINSSWLLVFISLFYLLLMGLNLYWWKGIHFS